MVPLRTAAWGFDAAVSEIDASPWPDVGETWIQDASLAAVHVHSRSACRLTSTRPPPAGIVGGLPREIWQRELLVPGAVTSVTLVDPHPRRGSRATKSSVREISRFTTAPDRCMDFASPARDAKPRGSQCYDESERSIGQ